VVETTDYHAYLALDELLSIQGTRTREHDELLFLVTHQVHELWFKLILHELAGLQAFLAAGTEVAALRTLQRTTVLLRSVVADAAAMETLTPHQFDSFRHVLAGSGAQSTQFKRIEAVLGRRDPQMFEYYRVGEGERAELEQALRQPTVFDSFARFLADRGYPVPDFLLNRDVSQPSAPSEEVQQVLRKAYLEDAMIAQICDAFLKVDQCFQEWRYHHVKFVAAIIGDKTGTGGSSGIPYLRSTLFLQMFPDLWAMRSTL
jgi:tryptophan 2,3-dioxygenase